MMSVHDEFFGQQTIKIRGCCATAMMGMEDP
jgi:hypothetical protein